MKVLIAEDRTVSRTILHELIEKQGHQVRSTKNGSLAWDAFKASAPEVILTDWDMPQMDGLQLTRHVRGHTKGDGVYIIMLSAVYTLNENFYQAMNLGVNDFLSKPYTKRDLIVRLRLAEKVIEAHRKIRELESFLRICCYCKKVCDEHDEWRPLEEFIHQRTGTEFSHGMCPVCYETHAKPEIDAVEMAFKKK